MKPIELRAGSKSDVTAIASILVDSWRTAYAGFLPADFLAGLSLEKQASRHIAAFDKGAVYVVATEGNEPVGFASFGKTRFPYIPAELELYTMYVRTSHLRMGIGSKLLDRVLEQISVGIEAIGVLAMKRNPHLRFYEDRSFHMVGEEDMDLGGFKEVNVILVRRLDS